MFFISYLPETKHRVLQLRRLLPKAISRYQGNCGKKPMTKTASLSDPMGPQAGQTQKLVKKNRNRVHCAYILMELASRNLIMKDFMLKMKTLITLK